MASILFLFFLGANLNASTLVHSFSDENQYFMPMQLSNGLQIANSITIYQVGTRWYLPIEDISVAMGLALHTTPALGIIEGFVIKETNRLHLDIKKCEVARHNKLDSFDCGLSQNYEDIIYLDQELVEKILPVKISIDPYRAIIVITELEKLPITSRMERSTKIALHQTEDAQPREVLSYPPYNHLDGIFFDQQLGLNVRKINGEKSTAATHTTAMSGEIFKMEAMGWLSGDEERIDSSRLRLSKKDSRGNLLGPLRATDIELLDIQYPVIPLISQGASGQGIEISNFPLYVPSSITQHRFAGVLPPGWDVELYQDGVLIGRQNVNSKGEYEFSNVALNYGSNRFKFIYYGPQGQRSEEYKIFDIRSSQIKQGVDNYKINYSKVRSTDERMLLEYRRGLTDNITLQTAYSRLAPEKSILSKNYGLIGVSSYGNSYLLNTSVVGSEGEGWAAQILTQFQWRTTSFGLSRSEINDFTSEVFKESNGVKLEHQSTAKMSTVFFEKPSVRFILEAIKNEYSNPYYNNYEITNRLSTTLGRTLFFNDISYITSDNTDTLTGELSLLRSIQRGNIRGIASYNKNEMTAIGFDSQLNLTNYSLRYGAERKIIEHITMFTGGFSKKLKYFDFNMTASISTNDDYSVGLYISYGLQRDSINNRWNAGPDMKANLGSASVFAYIDKNNSNTFDEGDEPLSGIEFKINETLVNQKTDASGLVHISGLSPYKETSIEVSEISVKSPYIRVINKTARFIPRPGKTMPIEIPFVLTGDIDGEVIVTKDNSGEKNVIVELVSASDGRVIATTTTESDGYYSFDGVPRGKYRIRLNEEQSRRKLWQSIPSFAELDLGQEDMFDQTINFGLVTSKP